MIDAMVIPILTGYLGLSLLMFVGTAIYDAWRCRR